MPGGIAVVQRQLFHSEQMGLAAGLIDQFRDGRLTGANASAVFFA